MTQQHQAGNVLYITDTLVNMESPIQSIMIELKRAQYLNIFRTRYNQY